MHQICRTCLKETEDSNFVNLKDDTNSSETQSKFLLCVPELNVDLVLGPVLCTSCVDALNSAYIFKTMCLRTEKLIQNYVDTKKLQPNSILLTDFNLQAYILQASSNEDSNAALKTEMVVNDYAQFEFNDVNNIEDTKDIVIKEELILDDIKIDEDGGDFAGMQSSFSCDKCEFQTAQENVLKLHQELMHFKIFICTECSYKTNTNSLFKNHMKLHNKGGPYQCNLCSFSTENNLALQTHVEVHLTHQICSICGYRSKTLHGLIQHIVGTHKEGSESMQKKNKFKNLVNTEQQRDIVVKEVIVNDTEESDSNLNLDQSQRTGVKRPFAVEKSFSCNDSEFETIHESSLKVHSLDASASPAPTLHLQKSKKKQVTGYILFSREIRKQVVQENPGCNFGDISKILSHEWRSLSCLKKQEWHEKASGFNKRIDSSTTAAPCNQPN